MSEPIDEGAKLVEELTTELRRQAEDEINRQNGAAAGYENALYLVESYLPRIERAAFYRGARRVAEMSR